jgi:hypothetical protein
MENWKDISEEESGLLKQGLLLFFDELGSTDDQYHARIFEHIHYQRHRYLFWVSRQGVCH